MVFCHFPKTTEANVLKFRVELDFSHMVAQKKVSGHSDKVAITVIHVTCTGSFGVHSTVNKALLCDKRKTLLKSCHVYLDVPVSEWEWGCSFVLQRC